MLSGHIGIMLEPRERGRASIPAATNLNIMDELLAIFEKPLHRLI